ncbi:MAG: O-antigen ligase family protein [Proteobacteria bacterium]|nr:O-antigen ligase family protein [Pseudomonadota bacterium]
MFGNPLRESTLSRIFVLCAVIVAQKFLPTEFSSPLFVLLGLLIMAFGRIQRSNFKLVWPLLGVLTIGLIGVFDHESLHIIRDISFALTPVALIFIGSWIASSRDMWPLILKIMVFLGFAFALIHLSVFVQDPELLSYKAVDVRRIAGTTGDLVALAFLLGLFQKRFGIKDLFPKQIPHFIIMLVLFASFVLSYSRTELAVAIILSFALWGLVSKIKIRMVLAISMLIACFFAIAMTTPTDDIKTFRGKLVRSVTEITISDYQGMSDIHHNWRGYETYRALASFSSVNVLQQIFGQGFGAVTDLGLYMNLGGEDFRYIPIFHNGYAYILVKTGLLGLACYAFFYINVIRITLCNTNSLINEQKFLARLLLGCVLSLIFTMSVVGGMAQMHNSEFVLLLGYLVRQIGQSQADENQIGVVRISR